MLICKPAYLLLEDFTVTEYILSFLLPYISVDMMYFIFYYFISLMSSLILVQQSASSYL